MGSLITAVGNDYGLTAIFSRQVEALGRPGDVLLGISTSGNSANVCQAFLEARSIGMRTVALLGGNGGEMKDMADHSVIVPADRTARIQEAHIFILHAWAEAIESGLYAEKT